MYSTGNCVCCSASPEYKASALLVFGLGVSVVRAVNYTVSLMKRRTLLRLLKNLWTLLAEQESVICL